MHSIPGLEGLARNRPLDRGISGFVLNAGHMAGAVREMVPVPVELTAVGMGVRSESSEPCARMGHGQGITGGAGQAQVVCVSPWSFVSLTPVPPLPRAPGPFRRWQSRGDSKSRVTLGPASSRHTRVSEPPVASQTTPAPGFPSLGLVPSSSGSRGPTALGVSPASAT